MAWNVPEIWKGGRCWIIGGGSSMLKQFKIPNEVVNKVIMRQDTPAAYAPFLSVLKSEHIIGTNKAYTIADWIDFNFYGDHSTYVESGSELVRHPGITVTCARRRLNKDIPIKRIERVKKGYGISTERRDSVCWNENTGSAAINFAVLLGVQQIILLGFDMDQNVTFPHWHGYYLPKQTKRIVKKDNKHVQNFNRFLKHFSKIAKDADKLGVEILNANPDSKIDWFKKVEVKSLI